MYDYIGMNDESESLKLLLIFANEAAYSMDKFTQFITNLNNIRRTLTTDEDFAVTGWCVAKMSVFAKKIGVAEPYICQVSFIASKMNQKDQRQDKNRSTCKMSIC